MDNLEYLKRIDTCALKAWNKLHKSYVSKEQYDMWVYVYNLFATERDTIGCMV